MENVRKHRDIMLVGTEKGKNYLVLEPNYHTNKTVYRKVVTDRNKKNKVLMNRSNNIRSNNI